MPATNELAEKISARLAEPFCKTGSQCIGGKCERCAEQEPLEYWNAVEGWAVNAGLHDEMWFGPHTPPGYEDCLPKIKRFAALVAAAEREACAKEVDRWIGCDLLAAAIRARREQ